MRRCQSESSRNIMHTSCPVLKTQPRSLLNCSLVCWGHCWWSNRYLYDAATCIIVRWPDKVTGLATDTLILSDSGVVVYLRVSDICTSVMCRSTEEKRKEHKHKWKQGNQRARWIDLASQETFWLMAGAAQVELIALMVALLHWSVPGQRRQQWVSMSNIRTLITAGCNTAIVNVISHTCAFPAVSCKTYVSPPHSGQFEWSRVGCVFFFHIWKPNCSHQCYF